MSRISDIMYRANYAVFQVELVKMMPRYWQTRYNELKRRLCATFPEAFTNGGYVVTTVDDEGDPIESVFTEFDVFPVCLMLSMPGNWENQMADLMDEFSDLFEDEACQQFKIERANGQEDPYNYRHDRFTPGDNQRHGQGLMIAL